MIFPLPQYINHNSSKIPVDALTGKSIDPHNPNNHLTHQEASDRGALYGLGVGFVFTAQDPYFFVDIDHCLLDNGQWSQLALDTCAQFPGCYVEVSISGTGLHIFGAYTTLPEHSNKNIAHGLEFYTQERYAAMGTGASGSVDTVADAPLQQLISNYFTPGPTATSAEWTTTHDPNSNPIVSDEELIAKMLASRPGATSVFGTGATIQDLWNCNTTALSIAYPHEDGFDRSSADAALVQRLAFWTGKNCERIEHLFSLSGLVRDKWTTREDYRRRTILNACARCEKTYRQNNLTEEEITQQFAFNSIDNKVYELAKPAKPGMIISAFKRAYGIYDDNWLVKPEPVICGFGYHPAREAVFYDEHVKDDVLNTFMFPTHEDSAGSVTRFLHLTQSLWDIYTPYILDLLASIIQEPHRRIQVMPILVSGFGAGKDTWIDYFKACIGYWNCSQESLANIAGVGASDWGDWAKDSLLCVVSEAETPGKEKYTLGAAIRDKITNSRLPLNLKGGKNGSAEVFTTIIGFSNLNSSVMIPRGDRRLFIHRTDNFIHDPNARGQYFRECQDEIRSPSVAAALFNFFKNRTITNDPYGHAPVTPYKELLMGGDNDIEIAFNQLITEHPTDIIMANHLKDRVQMITGITDIDEKQYKYALGKMVNKINGGKRIRYNGSLPQWVYALRNPAQWVSAGKSQVRDALGIQGDTV